MENDVSGVFPFHRQGDGDSRVSGLSKITYEVSKAEWEKNQGLIPTKYSRQDETNVSQCGSIGLPVLMSAVKECRLLNPVPALHAQYL